MIVPLRHGADFGQQGIFFDLDPPALVFRQVPVEIVHFMQGDIVDESFDEFDGKEMPADVEVQAAPGKAGIVVDGDGGDEKCRSPTSLWLTPGLWPGRDRS
jgi:hypothetical protein